MTPAIRCVDLHKTYPGKPPIPICFVWTSRPRDWIRNRAGNFGKSSARCALLARLAESQRNLSKLAIRHASLDDVFVKLAGRHLEETSEGTPKS